MLRRCQVEPGREKSNFIKGIKAIHEYFEHSKAKIHKELK
jgi:hypothetical protein